MFRNLLITGLVAGVMASSAVALTVSATTAPAAPVATADDPKPAPTPETKKQVTYWVLEATGKG